MGSLGELTIATTIDDRWVPHFATCVASLAAARGPESVRFVMLQGPSLSDVSVRSLRDFVADLGMAFDAIPISASVDASLPPTSRVFSPLVWYRLLLPELLPELDRLLFLDADTLVLQSLAPLSTFEFGDNLVAAVGQPTPLHHAALDPAPDEPYFNAGLLVMNLEAMRAENLGPRALALGHERHRDFIFNDQDVLNVLTRGRWTALHPRWNAMSHLWFMPDVDVRPYTRLEATSARHSPAIVHFEGHQTVKPWFYRSVHPLRYVYRDYRAQTPWPLEELELKSVSGSVVRRFPIRMQYAIARAKFRLAERSRRRLVAETYTFDVPEPKRKG